jgi:hypothetical protein
MMGIPPSEAKRLTYWEFTAVRATWNERHESGTPTGEPAEPPSEDFVRARQRELVTLGISGTGA